MAHLCGSFSAFVVSIVAVVFMGILIHENSNNVLNELIVNTAQLGTDTVNVSNNLSAIINCQTTAEEKNEIYNQCLQAGTEECGEKSVLLTEINTNLTIKTNAALQLIYNEALANCNNRTNQIIYDISQYTAKPPSTLLSSGTVSIVLEGSTGGPVASTYQIYREIMDDLILDYLVLGEWTSFTMTTATVNPTLVYSNFNPPVCIYGKKKPMIQKHIEDGIFVVHEEDCGTITFYGQGSVGGNVRVVKPINLFF